jgi:hypothetical protein
MSNAAYGTAYAALAAALSALVMTAVTVLSAERALRRRRGPGPRPQ